MGWNKISFLKRRQNKKGKRVTCRGRSLSRGSGGIGGERGNSQGGGENDVEKEGNTFDSNR